MTTPAKIIINPGSESSLESRVTLSHENLQRLLDSHRRPGNPIAIEIVPKGGISGVKTNQPWAYGEYKLVRVPIYKDSPTTLKDGTPVARYRVPFLKKGKPTLKSFRKPDRAKRYATEEAQKIADRTGTAKTAEANDAVALALYARDRAAVVNRSLVSAVEELVDCVQRLNDAYGEKSAPSLRSLVDESVRKASLCAQLKPALVSSVGADYIAHLDDLLCKKKVTQSEYDRARAVVGRFMADFGPRLIHTVRSDEITDWFARMTDIVLSTAVQYRSAVRNFFTFALFKNALPHADEGTAAELASLSDGNHKTPTKKSIGIYTANEVFRILMAARRNRKFRRWLPVLIVWFFGGVHFAEIMRLRLRDFVSQNMLKITKEVSLHHGERFILFSPAAFTWIESILRLMRRLGRLDEPIVPTSGELFDEDNYKKYHTAFQRVFKAILKEAGVEFKENGLRHSYASHAFLLTFNIEFVSLQMGSAESNMFKHYFGALSPHEVDAYFKIARPGSGDFSGLCPSEWLPDSVFKNEAQAVQDVNKSIEKRNRKGKWSR